MLGNYKHIPKECSLENVLDGADFSAIPWNGGPDNGQGMLAFVEPAPRSGGRQAQVVYDLDKQTWCPIDNEEGKVTHWIGWETANPPTSRDLQRPKLTEGIPLNLGGWPYLIPLATFPDTEITSLPQRFGWKRGGVKEVVKDKYADLCVKCKKQFDWMRKKEGCEGLDLVDLVMEDYEQFYLCVDLLNVNYRVSGPECCALDLLDSVSINYVIRYSLGWPYYEAQERVRGKAEAGKAPPSIQTASSDT